jgi:2-oxo-3-hexenedioate decarboxylase/2-keto-4-pentenoate hydratase
MLDDQQLQQAAQFLLAEHQNRNPFGPFPEAIAPNTVADAYAVQERFNALVAGADGPIAGYKIALTTPVMQRMVGFHEPCSGNLFAKTIHHSPVTLAGADYVRLGVECEIAVRLGQDLPPGQAPYDRKSVGDAVEALMVAFEVVDDRGADYSNLFFPWVIADNTWNAGVILGPPVTDWRDIDLAAAQGTMRINGEITGEGHGSDVMGHPLEALAWLANLQAQRGTGLSQGMIVMTGSIVTTTHLHIGDSVIVSVEGLGEATLQVS